MIPTVLVIALVGVIVFPRRGMWVVGVAAVAWGGFVLADGSAGSVGGLLGPVALAAVNAAAVVIGATAVRRLLSTG